MSKVRVRILFAVLTIVLLGVAQNLPAQFRGPRDPGVRGGAPGAGGMLAGLTADEQEMLADGRADFNEAEEVGDGLGPRLNFKLYVDCHSQQNVDGTWPAANRLFTVMGNIGFRAKHRIQSYIQ